MTLRTRIFLIFGLVAAASFSSLVYWIRDDLRPRYLESLEEPLVDTAHIFAELLADQVETPKNRQALHDAFERVYARRFQARIYGLVRDRVDMRVYVTDAHGVVVFDSDNGRDEGRDYSRWNDVTRALRGEYGARSSRDDPLDPVNAVVYVAAPVIVQGRIAGAVSVGKPKRNIDTFVRAAQQKILIAGLIAASLAILFGFVLSAWVTRPLERLTAYAEAVKRGQHAKLPPLAKNEIGLMGTALEEMRTALEGKDYIERYVQTLTHELKSPLAAIRGAAELLSEEMSPGERQRFLDNIRSETQRLQELVDRLLHLAAIEKRRSLEAPEKILLAPLIRETVESLHPLLKARNVQVRQLSDESIQVEGERFLIRQALANLLQNAIEFSRNSDEIEISAKAAAGRVAIHIRDHGPGIPEYALGKVFDRFYSLPRPDTQRKSTGLGLTFVREVVHLHGGEIRLENKPEGGACVILELPLA